MCVVNIPMEFHDYDLEADGCKESSLETDTALGVVASRFFYAPEWVTAAAISI